MEKAVSKYKTRKYFADIDDLMVCQSKAEAVRNVDSQNKLADFSGIKVHYNHSTLNLHNTRSHGFHEIWFFRQRAKMIRNVKCIVKMTNVNRTPFPILAS